LPPDASPQAVAAAREQVVLHLWRQYLIYLVHAVQGASHGAACHLIRTKGSA
jgi:hypothetical protein